MQAKGRNPGRLRDASPDSATLHPGYLFGSGFAGLGLLGFVPQPNLHSVQVVLLDHLLGNRRIIVGEQFLDKPKPAHIPDTHRVQYALQMVALMLHYPRMKTAHGAVD